MLKTLTIPFCARNGKISKKKKMQGSGLFRIIVVLVPQLVFNGEMSKRE